MRLMLAMSLIALSSSYSMASEPNCASTSRPTNVATWRPQVWHPPTAAAQVAAGIRFEPEQGATRPTDSEWATAAAARRQALANVPVLTRADGSRYAVLGGLVRAYAIARIGPDGRLFEECVHSEEQARQRIAAAKGR